MKYLEVKQISVAREDLYQAGAYPWEGVWQTQYDRDPVCVVAGRVWRLPAGSGEMVRDNEEGKDEQQRWVEDANRRLGHEGRHLRVGVGMLPALGTDPTALRRWAMERAIEVAGRGGVTMESLEKGAEEILKWVLQL